MNRRQFARVVLASSTLTVIGCDTDQKPATTATLFNNSGVQEALKTIEDAISSLESNVENFDVENWREVVPEVKNSTDEVRDAFERLRSELQVANSN